MHVLITGGAGFIGSNLAARGLLNGYEITILDNLSREGTNLNLEWLKTIGDFKFVNLDICNFSELLIFFKSNKVDVVFHQAAQVAVTTSVKDPRTDFNINALGTINLLEAIRTTKQNPVLIYASTNKVYGALSILAVEEKNMRYCFRDFPNGVPEQMGLDFYSPYGCSKGAADQYFIDYRRIFGLKTIVFRQSCIYGIRQMGLEDQGWLAWFAICAASNRYITIYGDGKQVRDILYIDDLVDLYYKAVKTEKNLPSYVFNIGGGSTYSKSLLEVIALLEKKCNRKIELRFSNWRPGDQKVYISDIRAAKSTFNWEPKISPEVGINKLFEWVQNNDNLFKGLTLKSTK